MLFGLALLLGSAAPVIAQQVSPVKVTQPDCESLRVRIDNAAPQRCQVRVVELSSGQSLYNETYLTATYAHRFSFQNVPTGRYALVMHIGPDHYRYLVAVKTQPQHATSIALREVSTRQKLTPSLAANALADVVQ